MKLIILSLLLLVLQSCQSTIKTEVFEKELNENIRMNEKIFVPPLVKALELASILDSNLSYPYYKISTLIQQHIDSTMLFLTNTTMKDEEVKLEYKNAVKKVSNYFKDRQLFLKYSLINLSEISKKDSILNNVKGSALRTICRYHLEIFKIECLNELIASTATQCKWAFSGIDTLICQQIDDSKYSIDVIQSQDYITSYVAIDSVFKENKKQHHLPAMQAMKYNAILNFDTLSPGNYRINGSVNGKNSFKYLFDNKFTLHIHKK